MSDNTTHSTWSYKPGTRLPDVDRLSNTSTYKLQTVTLPHPRDLTTGKGPGLTRTTQVEQVPTFSLTLTIRPRNLRIPPSSTLPGSPLQEHGLLLAVSREHRDNLDLSWTILIVFLSRLN